MMGQICVSAMIGILLGNLVLQEDSSFHASITLLALLSDYRNRSTCSWNHGRSFTRSITSLAVHTAENTTQHNTTQDSGPTKTIE
mmetsp:Transcript_24818/g.52867  ORF Transcript_24818/g.52867 Transcript_24818/m.52867 type:complete len:85 (+) Transcript_24818:240-494(+)